MKTFHMAGTATRNQDGLVHPFIKNIEAKNKTQATEKLKMWLTDNEKTLHTLSFRPSNGNGKKEVVVPPNIEEIKARRREKDRLRRQQRRQEMALLRPEVQNFKDMNPDMEIWVRVGDTLSIFRKVGR